MLLAVLALLLNNPAAAADFSVKRVAVLEFETAHEGGSGLIASDRFGVFLQKNFPGVAVVERARLERLLTEQHLQYHSGVMDPATAARLQSILGVDSVVIGSIIAMDVEAKVGRGHMMMEARLLDTSSGRILWADTLSVEERPGALRGLMGSSAQSEESIRGRLIEKAAFELVEDLGLHLSREALEPVVASEAPVAKAPAVPAECVGAEARVAALGGSIVDEEALYWAHRMREEPSLAVTPGMDYPDEMLRQKLAAKIFYWLGEKELPTLSETQASAIIAAKGQLKALFATCGSSTLALLVDPPHPDR